MPWRSPTAQPHDITNRDRLLGAIGRLAELTSSLTILFFTLVGLKGQPPLPWPQFAPFKALLDRCYTFCCTDDCSSLPKADTLHFSQAISALLGILIHSGHSRGRDASPNKALLLFSCEAPWIACQTRVKDKECTPCEATSVLNEVTMAFSGLSMCANVSALAAPDHVSSADLPLCQKCRAVGYCSERQPIFPGSRDADNITDSLRRLSPVCRSQARRLAATQARMLRPYVVG